MPRSARSRMSTLGSVGITCFAWLLVLSPWTAAEAQITAIKLGVAEHLRLGEWAAVTVELAPQQELSAIARLEVESTDGDGAPAVYDQAPIRDSQNARSLVGWFRLGGTRGEVRVRLKDAGGQVLAEDSTFVAADEGSGPAVLPLTTRLVVVVGLDPAAQPLFAWSRSRADSLRVVFIESFRDLPATAIGLRNLDTLVLAASSPALMAGLDAQRQEVLESWVRGGGRMLFWTSGDAAEEFQAGGRLAAWIPGQLSGFEQLGSTTRLDFLLKAKQPLIPLGQPGFEIGRLQSPVGNVLATQEDIPLVVRRQWGLGQIAYSSLALDREPLLRWEATPRLLDALLNQSRLGEERLNEARPISSVGFQRDLIEQLRAPLETFRNVSLISFTTVALLIGLLLLLVGPADYFLLRSLPGRKMEWTWLTFPLTVLAFSGLAWWLSARSHPVALQFNQLEVVDIDVTSGRQRGTAWTAIYSPQAEAHRVSGNLIRPVSGQVLDEQTSWLALPGGAVGGFFGSNAKPYTHRATATGEDVRVELEGYPFPVRSTRTLLYQWQGESQLSVRSQLRYEAGIGRLVGTFTNPFDFPLRNCRIYYEGWAYVFDQPVEAGDTVDLLTEGRERTIKSILTQRDKASAEGKTQNVPWDPREAKLSRLLEMVMFHDSAGGQSYTGLVNRAHGRLEMSEHLELRQAIVVAELPQPMSQLQIDGQPLDAGADQRFSVVRLCVPVVVGAADEKSGP
ncbi:MAG: hypothetical protein ACK493_09110 [Planctomycetota bacterium]|jgi:hypothetical protein